jgi:hypothetical protein
VPKSLDGTKGTENRGRQPSKPVFLGYWPPVPGNATFCYYVFAGLPIVTRRARRIYLFVRPISDTIHALTRDKAKGIAQGSCSTEVALVKVRADRRGREL